MSENVNVPDEEQPEQPVTMSASVMLSQSKGPQNILEHYAKSPNDKIQVRFKAIGSAPILKQQVYKISGNQKFSVLIKFLRRQLRYKSNESLFCYINQSFSPAPDEIIANLFENFAVEGHLMVSYCNTVAFG